MYEGLWETIEVRDSEKGPVVVQAVWTLVQARTEGRVSDVMETLVVFRERQGDGSWKRVRDRAGGSVDTPERAADILVAQGIIDLTA